MIGRRGFSLFEVILATAMLLGSVIVLSELANVGRRHATQAEDVATAQRLCQNKLNELLSGWLAVSAVENEPIEEEPGWLYTVVVEPLGRSGLAALTVTVARDTGDPEHAPQFALCRWVRDPDLAAQDNASAAGGDTGDSGAPTSPDAMPAGDQP